MRHRFLLMLSCLLLVACSDGDDDTNPGPSITPSETPGPQPTETPQATVPPSSTSTPVPLPNTTPTPAPVATPTPATPTPAGCGTDPLVGTMCEAGQGVCVATGVYVCDESSGVIYCDATPGAPLAAEDTSCDGVDEDCDGEVDEDYVPVTSCGVGYCADSATPSACVDGHEIACTPGQPLSLTDDTCDGVDDNCDGEVDEFCPESCGQDPSSVVADEVCDQTCAEGISVLTVQDTGFKPTGLTFVDGGLLVANWGDSQIVAWDIESGTGTALFGTPWDGTTGLAWDGTALRQADIAAAVIYRLDATTGEQLSYLASPYAHPRGLDWRDGSIWVVDRNARRLTQVDGDSGETSVDLALSLSNPAGVAWCGGFLLVTDRDEDYIAVLNPTTGKAETRFAVDTDDLYGLACDGERLVATDTEGHLILTLSSPVRTGTLDETSYRATGDLGDITREACSPFDVYLVTGEEGEVVDLMFVSDDLSAAVAVLEPDGTVSWSQRIEPGEFVRVPDLVIPSAESEFRVVFSALTAGATGTYHYVARRTTRDYKHIWGTVTDTVTGDGIPGASVFLDSAEYTISTQADTNGEYQLSIPQGELPDFLMVSASAPGYNPAVQQVTLNTADEQVDFQLDPLEQPVVVIQATDHVTHLGDDDYSGAINSQFQQRCQGTEATFWFDVPEELLDLDQVILSLYIKGAQFETNTIAVNDLVVGHPSESPEDGSFGYYEYPVWVGVLQPYDNRLTVTSGLDGDYDDFEFVLASLSFDVAAPGTLLFAWEFPDAEPTGLTWAGSSLYVGTWDTAVVHELDTTTGVFTSLFAAPQTRLTGLEWDGTYLWSADNEVDLLYWWDPADRSVKTSFPAPGYFPRDLSWDGSTLWVADLDEQAVMAIDPGTGAVLSTIAVPGANTAGCEVIGTQLWVSDRDTGVLHVFSLATSEEVATYDWGLTDPYALEYHEGYLWISETGPRVIGVYAIEP